MPNRPARLAALSIDLDGIPHYRSIHGIPSTSQAAHAVYDTALDRAGAFARSRDLPLTLFAIGADLDRPESAARLRVLAGEGHAVENHSLRHRYDLSLEDSAAIALDIEQGARAIQRAIGSAPTGFRAPGYTVSDAMFDALEDVGVAFDSSVFPCPGYYAAKAFVLGAMRVQGRSSVSVLGSARVMAAPLRPYRPGRPWHERGARSFVELPIQVTPVLRLPVIGTSIALLGPAGARWLARRCVGEPLVNIELHGIDFLDASDGLTDLLPYQHELRIPLSRRLDALAAALDVFRQAGYSFVRLDEAARI
jgi:hypothetical protein